MFKSNTLLATNLYNQSKLVSGQNEKTTERLSSGYRINRAADDAANLTISEKMRSQIRGLNQANDNVQDGISYAQVADGAMNEAHAIMQRMREITVQALNDTNTDTDRAAIEDEYNELQSNLDDIFNHTEFNGSPIFEPHEDDYYSIQGNISWSHDQLHTILPNPTGADELTIQLTPGSYIPDKVTIKVPEGIYTTQELMDEIDDLLMQQEKTIVPECSLILEYTKNGFCNMNMEKQDGLENISGGLTYLFYGGSGGGGGGKIIGTTIFVDSYPLEVKTGVNDEFSFQTYNIEDGTYSKDFKVKLPSGRWSRDQVIAEINSQIKAQGGKDTVSVEKEGANCISLTAGYELIVGLSGNMFEIDNGVKYHSVFYDNRDTGVVNDTSAQFNGAAYLNSSTKPIEIKTGVNDKFSVRVDGKDPYKEIVIPAGSYSTMEALKNALNSALVTAGIPATEMKAEVSSTYRSINGVYGYYNNLKLTSGSEGKESKIEFSFQKGGVDDAVYKAGYEALFRDTTITDKAPYNSGSETNAYLLGSAYLSGGMTFTAANKTLTLDMNVNGTQKTVTLTFDEKAYSMADIVQHINDEIAKDADLSGKVTASDNGGRLMISGASSDVKSIGVNSAGAYKDLFTRDEKIPHKVSVSGSGKDIFTEGNTKPTTSDPATVTLRKDNYSPPYTIPSSIKIDGTNQSFTITVNGKKETVQIPTGTYSPAQIAEQLNYLFDGKKMGVTASIASGGLSFKTTLTGNGASLRVESGADNPALDAIVGKSNDSYKEIKESVNQKPAMIDGNSLTRAYPSGSVTIYDGTDPDHPANDVLKFKYTEGATSKELSIKLPAKNYTYEALRKALQDEIDTQLKTAGIDPNKLTVTVDAAKGVDISTEQKGGFGSGYKIENVNGGFYDYVLSTTVKEKNSPLYQEGTHIIQGAFIVGRHDIRNSTTEIIAGQNDELSMKVSMPDGAGGKKDFKVEMTLDAGSYSGNALIDQIQKKLDEKLIAEGLPAGLIRAQIGGVNTGVANADDPNSLVFIFDKEPAGYTAPEGEYVIDGISGTAAYGVFYKSLGTPHAAYIVGSEYIGGGVSIEPGKEKFSFMVEEGGTKTKYEIDLPAPAYYPSGEALVQEMNKLLKDKNIPVSATVTPEGFLRLYYNEIKNVTIGEVDGSGKGTIFYHEEGRVDDLGLNFQIGANAGDALYMDKSNLSTSLLRINSLTVSKAKYAEKALGRIDQAIQKLSAERTRFGVLNNRFEHIYASNAVTSENTTSSESKIRDADIAKEVSMNAKQKIMQQAQYSLYGKISGQSAEMVSKLFQ